MSFYHGVSFFSSSLSPSIAQSLAHSLTYLLTLSNSSCRFLFLSILDFFLPFVVSFLHFVYHPDLFLQYCQIYWSLNSDHVDDTLVMKRRWVWINGWLEHNSHVFICAEMCAIEQNAEMCVVWKEDSILPYHCMKVIFYGSEYWLFVR